MAAFFYNGVFSLLKKNPSLVSLSLSTFSPTYPSSTPLVTHEEAAMSLSTSLLPSSPPSLKLPLATPLRPSSLHHLLRTKPLTPKPSRRLRCNAQLLSEVAPAAAVTYGSLLLTGGVFAYVRSGSKGPILGGATGGVLLAAAYYLMQTPETKAAGDALAFGSAFLFSAVFGIRLVASKKIVPAGALLALSLGSLAVFVSAYLQDKI